MSDLPPSTNGYREVQCIYIGSKEAQSKDITELPRSRPRKTVTRKNDESREAFLKRHSRKCQVCHHPDRDAIEGAFVMWRRPRGIAEVYRLTGDSLYRHAVAFDLYTRRRNNLRSVLDNIMERGVETDITGETILGTVKAYACLDDSNKWIEPTSNVIFSTRPTEARAPLANVTAASLPETNPTIDVAVDSEMISRVTNYEPTLSGAEGLLATGHSSPATASNRNSQESKINVTP